MGNPKHCPLKAPGQPGAGAAHKPRVSHLTTSIASPARPWMGTGFCPGCSATSQLSSLGWKLHEQAYCHFPIPYCHPCPLLSPTLLSLPPPI